MDDLESDHLLGLPDVEQPHISLPPMVRDGAKNRHLAPGTPVAASATAQSLVVWQKYSRLPSLPGGSRKQGRHLSPERLLPDNACTRFVSLLT